MSSLTFASLLRAPNPGPMTLDGTNTWVLRGQGSAGAVVVDPGPANEGHLALIAATGPIEMIMLTHFHHDHTEGVDRLRELVGDVPVAAADPALCRHTAALRDGDRITAAGVTIEIIRAPGHTSDSVCLLVTGGAERGVCTGDTILGRGTTVVSWPDGNLGDYLATLDKLSMLDGVLTLTGHGPVRADCGQVAREYRAHRDERLVQVGAALAAGARTPAEVVSHVYPELDEVLRPAAESTVRSALDYLDLTLNQALDPTLDATLDATLDPTRDATLDPALNPALDPAFEPMADPTLDPT
jgi:glyoxylase-like metal-dependent hydrolase (beta-lactamase superfamily II)